MMRSLFSGVTGLRTHQTKMDVIGNNISNVNTLGYKKSQANFSDIYSQTVSPSSAPSGNNGGINAKQVGLGVQMASIQIKHNPGAAQYTGNTLDLAIQGDGFFAVRTNADGRERYTRAGNLSVSSNGSLVTSAGNFVQCFTAQYKAGDAGVVSSNGFIGTDGKPAKASGFTSFNYTPDYGAIVTTASGTYTVELASDNTSVLLMKNGIAIGDAIPIQEVIRDDAGAITYKQINMYTGFKPNSEYVIQLPELGAIRFETEGHRINANIPSVSVPAGLKSGTFELNTKKADDGTYEADKFPLGEYSIEYNEGTLTLVGPTANEEEGTVFPNPTNVQVMVITTGEDGTDTEEEWNLDGDVGFTSGQRIEIRSGLGTMTFGASTDLSHADALKAIQNVTDGAKLTMIRGAGEGPANLMTGLASLNGLLTGASMSVSNNDAFLATATRGDMIINQDLFENISIGNDGAVIGQLKTNTTGQTLMEEAGIIGAQNMAAGEKVVLGYVALATFSNAEGLEKVGENLYEMTQNSGRVRYSQAGTGGTGTIASSSLEMSNVDLSEEMVNMITTQRGFQANSRIITTSDTMLEELINLKR